MLPESQSESDNDAFSQLRLLDRLAPSHPVPQNTLTLTRLELKFRTNHTDSRHDSLSESVQSQQLRVSLRVDASPGCGGIAWPAGEVLSRYIARRASMLVGRNVIELGSGTGLVGLVAASAGAKRVWITDQAPLLDIMRANVSLNDLAATVQVAEYNWGSPKPDELPSRADLILVADCVYFEPAFPLLVSTLCNLVPVSGSGTSTEVLFCYKKRRKADKRFFTLLKKHFEWKQVDDDPDYPIYSREAISLLSLTRKR